ncbi:MAG: tetratricopeptide repeat protein [Bacteroidota bacterium]
MLLRSRRALASPAPAPFRTRLVRLAPVGLALFAASVAAAQTPGPARPVADPAAAEAAFDRAREQFDGALYAPAERAFTAFLARYPRHARAPEALYLQAEAGLAQGDADEAALRFAQFETAYPTHPLASRARLALGRYYYATGDYDRAETALLDAIARPGPPSFSAEASYLLGQTALQQGRPEAAASAFEDAAVAETPIAPAALYAMATVYVTTGDAILAADAFAQLAERYPASPENADVRLALAEALVRSGRYAEAAREIERRRPDLAGDDAERANLLLGEMRLRLGDAQGAVAPLEAVPSQSPYVRRAQLALGRAAWERGDAEAAVPSLQTARAGLHDAIGHEAGYYEGLALAQTGRLGEAEARLSETSARRPDGAYADAALLELGMLRYTRRTYAEAADAFELVLSNYPTSPYAGEAARMMGESFAALGDAARAGEAFAQAEALGTATAETRAEVAFQDAYALFRAERYPEATPALLAVAEADPTGPRAGEALFWAGESAFRANRFAQAEDILAGFVDRFPDHRLADAGRYVLAWTHFKRRDYAAAAAGFERFLSAYTRSTELVPYYADALLRLGDSYYALRRFEEARQVYARVPAATRDRQGGDYALFQTAQAFSGQGRADDALAAYARLLVEYPRSDLYAQALVARGALLSARGDNEEAIAEYERVLEERASSPAAVRALVGIGDGRANQERYPEAEQAYQLALQRYPNSPLAADALDGLTAALEAQGRGDEVDGIVANVEMRVSDPDALARIRFARAQAALSAGDDSLAVVRLERILSAAPPPDVEPDALLALAGAHVSTGRPGEAVRVLRRLQSRFPDNPLASEAELQLIDALLASGDAEAARNVAARYPATYPGDPERAAAALALEARALRTLGRDAEADDRLRQLLERYPDSAAASATRRDRPDLAGPEDTPDEDDDDQ